LIWSKLVCAPVSRASLYVHPEAEVLDRLRLAFFEELEVRVEEEPEARPEARPEQMRFQV